MQTKEVTRYIEAIESTYEFDLARKPIQGQNIFAVS